jgi:hypothetical protein
MLILPPFIPRIRFMKLILSLCLASLVSSLAFGQATRTWISGVGDDANPCSRTAPGKTFAGAISKTAAGGIISILDPGGFGAFTITKAITVGGEGVEGGILNAGVNGVIVQAGPNDTVVLKNLAIEGAGTGRSGILINSAKAVHIIDCRIGGCTNYGIQLAATASNVQVFVKDTDIRNCKQGGIWLSPLVSSSVLIEKTTVNGCGTGLTIGSKIKAAVVDFTSCGNTGAGILVNAGGKMALTRGTLSDNLLGVHVLGTANIGESTIAYNEADGVKTIAPGKTRSFGNNFVGGNSPNGTNYSLLLPW